MKFTTLLALAWATTALAAPQDSLTSLATQQGLPNSNTAQKAKGNCPGGIRYRKEFRDCSKDEIKRFIDAVLKLKEVPSVWGLGRNRYEDFALVHGKVHQHVHSVDPFIPFHRMFLLEFENALREVDDSVTVPYWNAAFDYKDPRKSTLWNIVGSSQVDGDKAGCVPDGPFKDWKVIYPGMAKPDCLRRGFDPYAVPKSRFWNEGEVAGIVNSGGNFTHFRFYIEYGIHANAHNFGAFPGTLSGDYSPHDPIFYLIHSYVDYLHITWQKSFDKKANVYPDPKAVIPFFNVTMGSVLDHTQFCYDYYAPLATGPNGNSGNNTTSTTTPNSEEATASGDSTNTDTATATSTSATKTAAASLASSNFIGSSLAELVDDRSGLDLLDDQDKSSSTKATNTTTTSDEPTPTVDSSLQPTETDLPIQPMFPEWAKMNGFDETKKSQMETTLTTIKASIAKKIAHNLPIYPAGWTVKGALVNEVAPKVDRPAVPVTKEHTTPSGSGSVFNSLSNLLDRIIEAANGGRKEIIVRVMFQLSDPNVTLPKDDVYNLITSRAGSEMGASIASLYNSIFTAIEKHSTDITVVVKFA
ncbi:hypothetical protein IWQ61_000591 [Dispira simplex]|nr:hypothetical protein IWQ61_000591 [Dispira simplex]